MINTTVIFGSYASDLFDENEHERRRHSERHAPRMPVQRTRRRRSTGKLQRQWSSSDDADGSSSKVGTLFEL